MRGLWGSYYIPKAIFYLLKGDSMLKSFLLRTDYGVQGARVEV